MVKISNPLKIVIILVFILLAVVFYESKRIEVLSFGTKNPVLSRLASLVAFAEKIKKIPLLAAFFSKDESFWDKIKDSPKIFDYPENPGIIFEPKPTFLIPEPPFSILIVGDSFIAERFGVQLEKALITNKNIVEVNRDGVYSTGLSRPDYFDWNEELKELLDLHNPNLLIVMLGANDGQDQRDKKGGVIHYGTAAWNEEYGRKVSAFLDLIRQNNIFVFWVGNTLPRDRYFSDKMANLNLIYRAECEEFENCRYVDTWNFLTDSGGKYSVYLPDENGKIQLVRTSDGIHATVFGSQIMAKKVTNEIGKEIKLEPINNGQ